MDSQCLGKLSRPGAKLIVRQIPAPLAHRSEPAQRLERPEKHKPIGRLAFGENIEKPVDSVVQIDVRGSGLVMSNEIPRAGTVPGMARGIVKFFVGFRFNDPAFTAVPAERAADEIPGTRQGSSPEKIGADVVHIKVPSDDR